jgi:anti-anti-sigma regulatory factor
MSRKKFQAKLRASDRYSFLRLRGVIDEDNHLMSLVPKLTGDVLIIDLAEVDRINSCGVRDWVNWLQAIEERGMKGVLIRCSTAIVAQINMVTNFAGNAIVFSFFAPYYSPSIDREYQKLIECETLLGQRPVRAPAFRCSETGEPLEFDDIEESYFAFVNAHGTGAADLKLKRLVDEVAPDLEAKIRALNEAGSGPLTGPMHSIGTLGGLITPEPEPGSPNLPPNYLDIDEELDPGSTEQETPFERPGARPLAPVVAEPPASSSGLLILFLASAAVVIGLLIYFAATGV